MCGNSYKHHAREKLTFRDMPKKLLARRPAAPPETSSTHPGRELNPLPEVLKPASQSGILDAVQPRAVAI